MNLCNDIGMLRVILLLKIAFNIITIVIPIIIMILIMIDVFKTVINPNENLSNLLKTITRRFIAALLIFFIPNLLFGLINLLTTENTNYNETLCINEATLENIEKLEIALEAEKVKEKEEREEDLKEQLAKRPVPESSKPSIEENPNITIPDNENQPSNSNIARSSRMTPFVNGVQKPLDKGDCMSYSDNCACPTISKFSGFYFTMESETGRKMSSVERTGNDKMVQVKVKCSDGSYISKTVNSKTKTNFETAFNKLCQLRTTGIDGVKISSDYLHIDGTLNERTTSNRKICSPHSYGIAIDINYDLVININGVNHKPYASQGKKTKQNYVNFINAIGGENNPKNVNYILWIYVFKPSGFTWGGNWSDASFDPMHYEVAL